MVKVNFNADEFNRNLKRAAEQSVGEGMRRIAADLQRIFDFVLRTHAGKPVEEIKSALAEACRHHDFNLDDEHLTAYASGIHEGRRVVVKSQGVRL